MILPIRKEGDPVLRQPTEKVVNFDMELQTLIDNMIETMRTTGMGLAAPQVGVSKKLFVAEFKAEEGSKLEGFPLIVVANPEVVHKSKNKVKMVEGCLSIPGRQLLIERPKKAIIKGQDRYGKPIEIKAGNLLARTVQHEIDHLNGTLMIDHIQESKVIFIGTGNLGVPALGALIADSQYKIVGVVTGMGRAQVRGQKVEENEILKLAQEAKLNIIQTSRIKDERVAEKITKLKPDIGVMADFGQIIPQSILAIPKFGIINIHPSLLPRWRGPSPVHYTILEGDGLAGITLMLTAAEMDAGPIVSQVSIKLAGSETTTILKKYLSEIGAALLMESLPYYLSGELGPEPQDPDKATFSKKISKSDGCVDGQTPAIIVERKIRAYDDWPKVSVMAKGKKIQLISAHFDEDGCLVIDRVKPEGKKEMSYADFRHGYRTELTFLA